MESCLDFIKRKNRIFTAEKEKRIVMKDIGRKGKFYFVREAWTMMPQSNLEEKVFIFERLRKVAIRGKIAHKSSNTLGDIEYRIGYFMVGKIGRANGRWIWGQFCPLIPEEDLEKLFARARKNKVIL